MKKNGIQNGFALVMVALLAVFFSGTARTAEVDGTVDLVHSFAVKGDREDGKAFRTLFVADPTLHVGSQGAMAPEAFFKAWARRLEELNKNGMVRRQHVTNILVEQSSSKEETVTATYLTTLVHENEARLVGTGENRFILVKQGAGWKIKSLQITSDTTLLDFVRLESEAAGPSKK